MNNNTHIVLTASKIDGTPIEDVLPECFGSQVAKDPKTKTLIIVDCGKGSHSEKVWADYYDMEPRLVEYIPDEDDLLYGLEIGCEDIAHEEACLIVCAVGEGNWGYEAVL